ncbi:hypothetical protein IWW45_009282, partial [Coemansia sp. RSA 485]
AATASQCEEIIATSEAQGMVTIADAETKGKAIALGDEADTTADTNDKQTGGSAEVCADEVGTTLETKGEENDAIEAQSEAIRTSPEASVEETDTAPETLTEETSACAENAQAPSATHRKRTR